MLFTVDGYRYGGKEHDRRDVVAELRRELPTLRAVVHIPLLGTEAPEQLDLEPTSADVAPCSKRSLSTILCGCSTPPARPASPRPSSSPRAASSSSTSRNWACTATSAPRTASGTRPPAGRRGLLVSGLLTGTTIVLYDGSPGYPDTGAQWRIAERTGATLFGTSAAYVMACRKAGVHPSQDFDLTRVQCVATTGSPLPPDGFRWLHDEVRDDLWIASVSGGTDVCSRFAGAVPTLPVYIGELQAPGLGTDLQSGPRRQAPDRRSR